ncbi:MAG: patatin-like phospholipase family protein, partial [Calditrichaeota bacterium]|nr:patatin-like phospholipase family protein [Calditrichota bacterium]
MLQRWAGKQPTVGLALGGGGVRGLAHVGVLEVFRRENIPVAAIAGSSMGAIVAAAYTLNPDYSETQLIDVLNEMSAAIPEHLKSTLPDHADRESIFERLRQFVYVERFILNSVSGWGMLPEGIAEASLNKLTPKKHLEESPIPLAVVSADLISGKKIIFRSGPAALALKASSAIPGFLPPVPYNDMLLVD